MRTIKCTLNCEEQGIAYLHLRPAAFVVKLCNKFPQTEFRVLRSSEDARSPDATDPKSIMDLFLCRFQHGEEVTVEVTGKCEIMASEFFKVVWENLLDYSDHVAASTERLTRLIDEAFNRIHDPDVDELGGEFEIASPEAQIESDEECRSVAVINDRLHNLSLAILPQLPKYYKCSLQIAFEVPIEGIFTFNIEPDSQFGAKERMLERILRLPVEVGTRITVVTRGSNRFKANAAVKNVLQSLWQCDDWLRKRASGLESDETIVELLEFAEKTALSQSAEYGIIQNPYISNLLTTHHVFVNPKMSVFSKEDVISQLACAHAHINQLELSLVMDRVREAEKREPIVLRDGFALAHGAMERTPRISITFGVYPKGVLWDDRGRVVRLVSMIVFAKDTYGTWRDYLKKMAIVFRANPNLQELLIASQTSEEFRATLRRTETAMIK